MLILAVAIQRINGIQRWLTAPRNKRKEHVTTLAQQALIDLCMNRVISEELLDLCVHVWEVPLWYRRLFPYAVRTYLKRAITRKPLKYFAAWAIRPTLHRVAAVGLVKPTPSGIRFRKGSGLIGVCIANNDRSDFIALNVSNSRYRRALKSANEAAWTSFGPEVTHNISLKEAVRLSHLYGQVVAQVVQDSESGEAVGCVTISIRDSSIAAPQLAQDRSAKATLIDLATCLGSVL